MFKAFSSHTLKSSTYGVSKYSSNCISVTMLLVLDACSVAMDTSFHPDDHFPATVQTKGT